MSLDPTSYGGGPALGFLALALLVLVVAVGAVLSRKITASGTCTSDDPANHQGDTCLVHEADG